LVDSHREGDVQFLQETVYQFRFFVDIEAQKNEIRTVMLIEIAVQLRHFLLARLTPGSKKVEHHDLLADIVGQPEALAGGVRNLKIRRNLTLPFGLTAHYIGI
jgi:hypothetical protein